MKILRVIACALIISLVGALPIGQTLAADTPDSLVDTQKTGVTINNQYNGIARQGDRDHLRKIDPKWAGRQVLNRFQYPPLPMPQWVAPSPVSPDDKRITIHNIESGETKDSEIIVIPSPLEQDYVDGWRPPDRSAVTDQEPEGGLKNFTDLVQVANPHLSPWRVNCKIFGTFPSGNYSGSGVLIDPKHVLTAGHVVFDLDDDAWASSITVVPGFESGDEPYGRADGLNLVSWTGWTQSGSWDWDMGIIELDRPVGVLTGGYGYGYDNDDSWFTSNTFHNPGYPGESPYNGQIMWYWYGDYDNTSNHILYFTKYAYGGQSGSGSYNIDGDNRYVYAVMSHRKNNILTLFQWWCGQTRINSDKFSGIQSTISNQTPSCVDFVPLDVQASPSTITAGQNLTGLNYVVYNNSSVSRSGSITVEVYASTNDIISTGDRLINTHTVPGPWPPKTSYRINVSSPPQIPCDMSQGSYHVGVIIATSDCNNGNNYSDGWDADPITIQCAVPGLSSLAINGGSSSTCNRTVTLNHSASCNPTQYLASESSTFSGAVWRTYSTAPSFTLSNTCGTKRVYFKTKNSCGESNVRNDVITLLRSPTLASFSINNGASSTCNRTVTLNVSSTCTPTQYMASESSTFSGAVWRTYSTAPSFTLSSGCGTKRIYVKLKNSCDESSVLNDVITLIQTPVLSSFTINSGAAATCNRVVSFSDVSTCAPTDFMVCENPNFSGCNWQTYSASRTFTLSAGCGNKTVYLQLRNSCGISAARSYTIRLDQVPNLTSFAINSGDATTESPVVTLNHLAACDPSDYQACEDPNFSGCSWQVHVAAPTFTLSPDPGIKTVYLRIRNTCGTSPTVSDQIELVDDNPVGSVAGEIYLWSAPGSKLCDVTVDLTGAATDATVTDENGQYLFGGLSHDTYTVTPSREVNDPGMSVSDIVKIRRHLAFLERFPSGYQYLAADVSNDCNVSVSDVVKLRRCLAYIDTLPCAGWAFVDAAFAVSTTNWCAAPRYVELPVNGDETGVDFVGVRLGDVTGNASIPTCGPFAVDRDIPNLAAAGKLSLGVGAGASDAFGNITVPLSVTQNSVVAGLELHLTFTGKDLEFVGLEGPLVSGATWNRDGSAIHLVWEDIENPLDMTSDTPLLGLKFAVLSDDPELSIEFTRAEFVDEIGSAFDLELTGGVVALSGGAPRSEIPHKFILGEAHPNPFNPRTTIAFSLPVATQVTLCVYNTLGQKVATLADAYYPAGEHTVEWDGGDAASGVYFYRLEAGSFMETKKMVLMK